MNFITRLVILCTGAICMKTNLHAALTLTLQESDGNVVLTGSGSLDLSSVTKGETEYTYTTFNGTSKANIKPSTPAVIIGSSTAVAVD